MFSLDKERLYGHCYVYMCVCVCIYIYAIKRPYMQPLVDAALALALWPGLWAVALHTALHSVRALQQIIHDELSDLEDMQPRKKKRGAARRSQ